ncbi:TPA: hypothetical protein U1C28_001989 [Streptococcus suis]|nr:hypothetical protein [Streptococcus suis]HEM3647274.1 hypothetical protein [Streptococcus suis]
MDAPFADAFYDVLNVFARDGASLGIYLVTALSRLNAMRLQFQSNFKTKISLFLFDNSDLSGVVGRSNIPLDEIKGRAITKLDEIIQFQVTLPYTSEAYADYIIEVGNEVEAMRTPYTGELPSGIPMLPEKVKPESIDLSAKDFIFGLDREWVQPAGFSFEKPVLMAAEGPSFINTYYKILDFQLKRLSNRYNTVILDNNGKVPNQLFEGFNRFSSTTEVSDVLQTIVTDLKERVAKPQESYQNWLVLIPDIASTGMSAGLSEADLKLLLVEGAKYGVTPLFVGGYQDLINNSYDSFVKLMLQLVDQVFLGVRISDQNHTRYPYINNEPALKPNQGYILYPEGYEFVQLMEL